MTGPGGVINPSDGDDIFPGGGDDNSGDEIIDGLDGAHTIDGGLDNDSLYGGNGDDMLTFRQGKANGGVGNNTIIIAENQALGQFLHNTANGLLSWDADKTGAGSAVAFTRLFTSAFTLPPAIIAVADFDIVV